MPDMQQFLTTELNPTFYFAWKGTRDDSDERYHRHDHIEVAYVLSGVGKYRIDDVLYDIEAGDLMIFNPGQMHQALAAPNKDMPATEFFVGFSDIALAGLEPNQLPLPEGRNIIHTSGELRERLFRLCTAMETERAIYWEGRYAMLKSYLVQLILLILRQQATPVKKDGIYSFESMNRKYVVERLLDYLELHYSEKISLDDIAENMYLSPFYVSRLFKSETGDTPIRHLINIRLEKAKAALESGGSESIQEIAASVGYDDAYHFSKLFKKRYGISPSQARKNG